jgi:hypothetical protein
MPQEPEKKKPESTEVDPVMLSFFTSEPEPDLDKVPTEEELEQQRADEEREARREMIRRKSFGSLGNVDFEKDYRDKPEEGEEEEEEDDDGKKKPDEEEEDKDKEGEEEKPKKKVSFRKPPEDFEPEPTPPQDKKPEPKPEPEEEEKPEGFQLSDEDRAFLDTLPDEAIESVEFFVDAEWVDEKYKGYAKRQLEYLKQHQAKIDELEEADPDTDVTENPKYLAWVKKNRPHIPQRERRRLEREIVIREAEVRAEKKLAEKYEKELDENRNWRTRQERMPKVQQRTQGFAKSMIESLSSVEEAEDAVKVYNKVLEETGDVKKAGEAMREEYPEESDILAHTNRIAMALGSELIALKNGIKDFDSQERLHQELLVRVNAQEEAMSKPAMKDKRIRDGRTFATAADYREMTPEQRKKHWTFSTDDMLSFIQAEARFQATKRLKEHKERVSRYVQKYGGGKPAPKNPDKAPRKEAPDDQPRHQGTDSPSSAPRKASGDSKTSASALVDWD